MPERECKYYIFNKGLCGVCIKSYLRIRPVIFCISARMCCLNKTARATCVDFKDIV